MYILVAARCAIAFKQHYGDAQTLSISSEAATIEFLTRLEQSATMAQVVAWCDDEAHRRLLVDPSGNATGILAKVVACLSPICPSDPLTAIWHLGITFQVAAWGTRFAGDQRRTKVGGSKHVTGPRHVSACI